MEINGLDENKLALSLLLNFFLAFFFYLFLDVSSRTLSYFLSYALPVIFCPVDMFWPEKKKEHSSFQLYIYIHKAN